MSFKTWHQLCGGIFGVWGEDRELSKMNDTYVVVTDELRSWRNRILQAEIQGNVPETYPHWWDGVPLTVPPPHLAFAVSAKGPMLDNYFTGTEFDLYSERLITLLRDAGVQFETFPATLVDRKTKTPLPVTYEVFHLLEVHPALDVYDSDDPSVLEAELNRERIAQHNRPFFRAQECKGIVLIKDTLRQHLDEVGIRGNQYMTMEEYRRINKGLY